MRTVTSSGVGFRQATLSTTDTSATDWRSWCLHVVLPYGTVVSSQGQRIGRQRTELGSPHSTDSTGAMAAAVGETVFEDDSGSSTSCVPAQRHHERGR